MTLCRYWSGTLPDIKDLISLKTNCDGYVPTFVTDESRTVRGRVYDMQEFVEECVKTVCKLFGTDRARLNRAPIPFMNPKTAIS